MNGVNYHVASKAWRVSITHKGVRSPPEYFPGPVKVNAVLLRGINDHEILDFAELARSRAFEIRFIEGMEIGLSLIRSLPHTLDVQVDGDAVTVELEETDHEVPKLLEALLSQGVRIRSGERDVDAVTPVNPEAHTLSY